MIIWRAKNVLNLNKNKYRIYMLKLVQVFRNMYQIIYDNKPCGNVTINDKSIPFVERIRINPKYAYEICESLMNLILKELNVDKIKISKHSNHSFLFRCLGCREFDKEFMIYSVTTV